MTTRGWRILGLSLCLHGIPAARAQDDDPAATALFNAGRLAAERGDWEQACERFQESERMRVAPGTLLNIANCAERLGRLALAWQSYTHALELLSSEDPRASFAAERRTEVEARLPTLTLRLAEQVPPATTITRDGVELGPASLGVPIPTDPGGHEIVVRAPGHDLRRYSITLVEAERQEILLQPGRASSAPPPYAGAPQSLPRETRSDSPARTPASWHGPGLVWAAFGVGAAGLASGVVLTFLAKGHVAEYRDICAVEGADGSAGWCPNDRKDDVESLLDTARTERTFSIVGFAVGGASVGAGVLLLLTAPDNAAESRPAARVEPWIAPGSAGVRGRF